MTANVLTMLPARARLTIYVVFGLLVIGQGAADAGYSALALELPAWLIVASAVLKFLSVPVVALAAVAVAKSPAEQDQDEQPELGTSLAEREGTVDGWVADAPKADPLIPADGTRSLGPDVIATAEPTGAVGSVINWAGSNYVPQPEPEGETP